MTRTFTALLLAAATLWAACNPAHATKIERVVSPGGIEAWLVHEPSLPLIAMNFAFTGGSSQDEKAGTGYMTAAMLDSGAGELDSTAYQQRIEANAVELRFSVNRDYLSGSIRMLRDRMDQSVELLRLALNEPRFDADELERTGAQIMASLRRETTNPNNIATKAWWSAAFPGHPYGRPENGTLETVPTIVADDLRAYARRVLTRATLTVAVVGDIDAAGLGQMLDRVFGGLPASGQLSPVPDVAMQGAGRRIVQQLDVPQSVVYMGGAGIAREDRDFIPAYIVNHILGGGSFSSRLYNEVREKRGLVYGVHSYLLPLKHTAMLMASTQASADRTAEALGLIESETARMIAEGPTEAELAKAKEFLKGSYPLNFDTSAKIANLLLQIQLDRLGIDYIDKRNGLIDAVTIEDVRRAARRLATGGMFVTVVGRPKQLASKQPGG